MCHEPLHPDAANKNPFFILPLLPLVRQKVPSIKPFICQKKPIVEKYKVTNGFTLFELIITITIAAILMALALPAMRSFVLDQRLTTQANDFIADLNYARSEAVRRGTSVTICRQGGTITSPSCNSAAPWGGGRIVFVDGVGNGNGTIDAGDTILRVRESLDGNNTMDVVGGVALGNIVIANTGLTTMTTGQEAALRICDTRQTVAMTISVNYAGHANSSRSTVTACP